MDDRRHSRPAAATAWEDQAAWYDARQGAEGDAHHRRVVLPAVLRQLAPRPGQTVLDCCCGQGVLSRLLAAQGCRVVGVDAAPALIAAARRRAGPDETFVIGDARRLASCLPEGAIDHAAIVLALQDVDDAQAVLAGVAGRLPAGGRCVMVLSHPCFRIPGASDWGDDRRRGLRYRRLDRYRTAFEHRIRLAVGDTIHHHRPLCHWLTICGEAGLAVVAAEELCSPRRGSLGPQAAAEDAAAREFPVFLLLTALRLPGDREG